MKRFFYLFLCALLSISLCVNIAFASDVVTARVDQNIFVYFPWFGGVSGSSASRVTNYAIVTSSDITTTGNTITNICSGYINNSVSGMTFTNNYPLFSASGTTGNISGGYYLYKLVNMPGVVAGHKYYVDTFYQGNFSGLFGNTTQFGENPYIQQGIITCVSSGTGGLYFRLNANTSYDFTVSPLVIDLTDSFGSGNEPSTVADVQAALASILGSYNYFSSSLYTSFSSFSLVPAPAANGGSSSHQVNDYTWYQYEADVSLSGENVLNQSVSDWLIDDIDYSYWYAYRTSGDVWSNFAWVYGNEEFVQSLAYSGYSAYSVGTTLNNVNIYPSSFWSSIIVQTDSNKLPLMSGVSTTYTYSSYISLSIRDFVSTVTNPNSSYITSIILSDPTDFLYSDRVFGDGQSNYEGTFTIDRIFRLNDNSYFLFNNQVNLGTYDFNVNVKFPSLDKFNSFSGYWLASFNTSWGEIPVRTQIQEVSSNSDTLIKIYKLTFDVPFTGQYTKFNIKYVGDSSAFTTIRVDSSVVDPNAYQNGAGPTSINGLSFYLSSMFDKFWGKVRSLFFDQDQTMEEAVSSGLSEEASQVSQGTESIHEFEKNTFDNIDSYQNDIDFDIPDLGNTDSSGNAVGFVSSLFTRFFNAIGVNIQVVVVVPLVLGLVLLVLGRGQSALGRLVRRKDNDA